MAEPGPQPPASTTVSRLSLAVAVGTAAEAAATVSLFDLHAPACQLMLQTGPTSPGRTTRATLTADLLDVGLSFACSNNANVYNRR